MKKVIVSILLSGVCFVSLAQFKGIEIEKVDNKNKVKGTTYRVYAVVTNETDQIYSVGGVKEAPAYIKSTKPFFQSPNGGSTSTQIVRKMSNDKPDVKYDSYVTIGREDNYGNQMSVFTVDFTDFEKGGNIIIQDGGWWALPDQEQTYAGPTKRVMIMQVTTEGVVTGKINLAGRVNLKPKADGTPQWENIDAKGITFTSADAK